MGKYSAKTSASVALVLTATLGAWGELCAQTVGGTSDAISTPGTIGVQGFGFVGMNWPRATESFEATAIDTKQMELGGGVVLSRVWRELFAEVTASQITADGERVFVDDDGTPFPLGIPLSVKATYIDVSAGWEFLTDGHEARVVPYVGGGVGFVKYSEHSPFATEDDDLESSATSYHVVGGARASVLRWLGVVGEVRYRWIPDLLGRGGASQAFGEQEFGGVQVNVGIWIGIRGRPPARSTAPAPSPELPSQSKPSFLPERVTSVAEAVILASAPVFLRPDAALEPLRTLEGGTPVWVLGDSEDWIRIEFSDRALGRRVGWVQRKYVRLPKL